jgi:2-keto-3-deoxy-L-rhamnonate aldolase RhmA
MKNERFAVRAILWMVLLPALAGQCLAQLEQPRQYLNTAKEKLLAGKKIFGGTVSTTDPQIYCAMAGAGFDFLWIEMQHSPLTYETVARMIATCPSAPATPFIRVPDATESDIQKATDTGALGIIIPMVDDVEKAKAAVKFANYPPKGRRSMGGGLYMSIYPSNYRQIANDNLLIVVMIESPEGVAHAEEIAAVPGVDVIFAASGDLGSFTGKKAGDPEYEALVARIRDATLKAGKKLGGPAVWAGREGFSFFQAPGEATLIRAGARAILGDDAESGKREMEREMKQKYGQDATPAPPK